MGAAVLRVKVASRAGLAESDRNEIWRAARPEPDPARIRGRIAPCPEIDCLRHLMPPALLAAAELRAAEIGTGADRVLVTEGALTDADYVRALSPSITASGSRLLARAARRLPARRRRTAVRPRERHDSDPGRRRSYLGGGALAIVGALSGRTAAPLSGHARHAFASRRWNRLREFIHREAETAVARKAAFELRRDQAGPVGRRIEKPHAARMVRCRHRAAGRAVGRAIESHARGRHCLRADLPRLERASHRSPSACRRSATAGAAAAKRRYVAALFHHRRDLQRGGIGAGCWPRR